MLRNSTAGISSSDHVLCAKRRMERYTGQRSDFYRFHFGVILPVVECSRTFLRVKRPSHDPSRDTSFYIPPTLRQLTYSYLERAWSVHRANSAAYRPQLCPLPSLALTSSSTSPLYCRKIFHDRDALLHHDTFHSRIRPLVSWWLSHSCTKGAPKAHSNPVDEERGRVKGVREVFTEV